MDTVRALLSSEQTDIHTHSSLHFSAWFNCKSQHSEISLHLFLFFSLPLQFCLCSRLLFILIPLIHPDVSTPSTLCPSLVYTCSVAHLKHSPLICTLTNNHQVRNVLDPHRAPWITACKLNLAGQVAAAQFAYLRQSTNITLMDDNTSKRLRTHSHTLTHTQTLAPVLLIVGY